MTHLDCKDLETGELLHFHIFHNQGTGPVTSCEIFLEAVVASKIKGFCKHVCAHARAHVKTTANFKCMHLEMVTH
jgi:hypothetical protein